jgi:hypothetical protein
MGKQIYTVRIEVDPEDITGGYGDGPWSEEDVTQEIEMCSQFTVLKATLEEGSRPIRRAPGSRT